MSYQTDNTKNNSSIHFSKYLLLAAFALLMSFASVGCVDKHSPSTFNVGSLDGSAEHALSKRKDKKNEPNKSSSVSLCIDAYRKVLVDQKSHFQLDEERAADASFSYALVDMEKGKLPCLLVKASVTSPAWGGLELLKVFSFDLKRNTLVVPSREIWIGVAGAGGFRGGLSASASGNGLLLNQLSSGTGKGVITRLTLNEQEITETFVAPIDFSFDSPVTSVVNKEAQEIIWSSVSDETALNRLKQEDQSITIFEDKDPLMAKFDAVKEAQSAGLVTFSGTVRILDAQGLCDLQGVQNPNPDYSDPNTYVVLDFGEKKKVTAHNGADPGVREDFSQLLLLCDTSDPDINIEYFLPLDGKQITVAGDLNRLLWPSDTSLPLGEPRFVSSFAIVAE